MAAFSAMPYKNWPAIDRALWFEAMSASELLDSGAIAATWRDATRATVAESYGYAVDWLLTRGHLRSHERPAQRWLKPVLADYIADLKKHVSEVTTKQRVLNLERALAAMEPESDRSLLRLAVRRLETPVSHAQKRERLQEPAALEALGRALMDAARRGEGRFSPQERRHVSRRAADHHAGAASTPQRQLCLDRNRKSPGPRA